MNLTDLYARLANYHHIILDLGTGDGKFAFCHADKFPSHFVIGVDACRENLHEHSRTKLPNLLYIIANAQNLPRELHGLISHITINFPWGSLLESLLTADSRLMCGLESISCPSTSVDVRLNGGALAEAGWSLEAGAKQIYNNMLRAGWHTQSPVMMNESALRSFPSTWAKRLAFGRDPHAIQINGHIK
jgi:16S rRNA (adenine(1408)-N(1))-methyltransferase